MKVLLALSGGVDSAFSAKILQEQGYELIGCYMILHDREHYHEQNIENVKKLSAFLNIEYKILDLREKFKNSVYDLFVNSYKAGLTPNPCAICNKVIKFGAFADFASSLGIEKIATGHYVRLEDNLLKVALDESKDQSYFLANIKREILPRLIFPLGDKYKKDIKEAASQIPEIASLAKQKESSEICFVDKSYIDILEKHFPTQNKGILKDKEGKIIGEHKGYANYTIGQRSGFTVKIAHDPHFVYKIDAENNEVFVCKKEELSCLDFETENYNAFVDEKEYEAYIKVRYRSKKIQGKVTISDNKAKVKLYEDAKSVASGQLAVFYDEKDRVLGSGFIA